MKALVSLPPLTDDHPNLHRVLGEGWLDRRVAAAREAMRRRSNLSPSMIGMTTGKLVRPLIDDMYQATNSTGAKVRQTLQLDLLEFDLRTLAGNLPGGLTNRLRNDDEATKVIYELRIAAGFTRIGMQIQWTVATGTGRRPEFVVNPSSAAPVSVECKKRDVHDGYEKDANRFFEHFQFKLRQRMEAQTLNYAVKLTAEQFRLGEVERVVKDIVQALTTQEIGIFKTNDGYLIEFEELAEPGGRGFREAGVKCRRRRNSERIRIVRSSGSNP